MLFFKRLGTEKKSYNITLNPLKIQSTSGLNTDMSLVFVRGGHSLSTGVYKPNNRQIVFKQQKLQTPSTMYYNTTTRIFIEKPATIIIKGKQLGGNQVFDIDAFEFDLAEYIGKSQQRVKFQFDTGIKLTANLEFVLNQKNYIEENSTGATSERKIEDKQNKINAQYDERSSKDITIAEKRNSQSVYLYQNQIKQKDKEIELLKQQNKRLNTVLDNISEQKPVTNGPTKSNQQLLDRFYVQNTQLNKRIVELEIQLSASDNKMKKISSSEIDLEKTIKAQSRRIKDLEEDLEESKNKMAVLLQDCFEQGDAELMSFIEQRLKK